MYSESISFGHLTRLLHIADILSSRLTGLRITFALSQEVVPIVKAKGYETVSIHTDPPKAIYRRVTALEPMYPIDTIRRYYREDLKTLQQLEPDLVLYDMRLTIPLVAEKLQIPFVSVASGIWTPYFNRNVLSVPYRVTERVTAATTVLERCFRTAIGQRALNWLLKKHVACMKQIAEENGLSPLGSFCDYVAAGNATLIADLPALVPLSPHPSSRVPVGPLLWEFPREMPERLRRLKGRKRTVYFTLGTSIFPSGVAAQIVKGLLARDYQVILTTGGRTIDDLPRESTDLYVYDYLPSIEVLKQADVVISHGGIATTYQALSAGVPVIGVPSFPDQQWHMDLVERVGAGRTVPTKQGTSIESILDTVDTVIELPAFSDQAKVLQDAIKRYPSEEGVLFALKSLI